MRPQDRDAFAQQRKSEAVEGELARHKRMSHVVVLLVVVLNVLLIAVLTFHLLGQD